MKSFQEKAKSKKSLKALQPPSQWSFIIRSLKEQERLLSEDESNK